MKKVQNLEFKERLTNVKNNLPPRYMTLVEYHYPSKFSKSDIYNVLNAGLENEKILKALESVVRKLNKSITKSKQTA
jgi:ribosome-associated translation inhibitor RaiA